LLALTLLAVIAGALTGLVGAIFRLSLEQADRLRDAMIGWAHGREAVGFLLVIAACAAATALAAWLVRRFSPHASEAASLTSKPFCAASFRRRRFS
jgi:CIC family chloride channel protein